jgi:hypothetical protein
MKVAAVVWLVAWGLIGLPWRSFSAEPSFARVRLTPFADGSPRSQGLNVLAFVPCGAIGAGLGWSMMRVILSGAVVSGFTELSQLFSTRRYPSATDLILNAAGTAAGVWTFALTRRYRRG